MRTNSENARAKYKFSAETKRKLEERAGNHCSFPMCPQNTSGPHTLPDKAVKLGEAGHIYSPKGLGPRYDPSKSDDFLRSLENGIWLCPTHHTLIDKDEEGCSAADLARWKKEREATARVELECPEQSKSFSATSQSVDQPEPVATTSRRKWVLGLATTALALPVVPLILVLRKLPTLELTDFGIALQEAQNRMFKECMDLCTEDKRWEKFWPLVSEAIDAQNHEKAEQASFRKLIYKLTVNSWKIHDNAKVRAIPELHSYAAPDGGRLDDWVGRLLKTEVSNDRIRDKDDRPIYFEDPETAQTVDWWLLYSGYFKGCKLTDNENCMNGWFTKLAYPLFWRSDAAKQMFRGHAEIQFGEETTVFNNFVGGIYRAWLQPAFHYD